MNIWLLNLFLSLRTQYQLSVFGHSYLKLLVNIFNLRAEENRFYL